MSTLITDAFWASRFNNPALGAKYLRRDGLVPLLSSAIAHSYPLITVTGNPISISDGAGGQSVESCVVTFSPIQASGTPSPDNVLPITGWSSVGVWRTGTNVWDEEWEVGTISNGANVDGSRIRSKNYISITPDTAYYVKVPSTYGYLWVSYYDADKAFIATGNANGVNVATNSVFTTPSNAHYMRFSITGVTTYGNDISINYPSSDTSYHAYTGESITADFADTYYSGTIDLVSGVGSVTHGIVDLGTLTWARSAGTPAFFSAAISGIKKTTSSTELSDMICSHYKTITQSAWYNSLPCISIIQNSERVLISDETYNDGTSADFKTAMSGVQLCYPLATPISFSVTPQTLTTLDGDNTIFTDADSLTVTYHQKVS